MTMFILPTECSRCKTKVKDPSKNLTPVSLPRHKPKIKGKIATFGYTPIVYLCNNCIESLCHWLKKEK